MEKKRRREDENLGRGVEEKGEEDRGGRDSSFALGRKKKSRRIWCGRLAFERTLKTASRIVSYRMQHAMSV